MAKASSYMPWKVRYTGAHDRPTGSYSYPCDFAGDVSMVVENVPFRLNLSKFNLGKSKSGGNKCVGGVQAITAL